jgi:hypothetical protein
MTTDERPALTDAQLTARDHVPGLVHHVVLFRLRDDAAPADRDEVERRFRALADSPHPDGSGPYIRSLHAGRQSSPEGVGRGFIADPSRIDAQHAAFKEFVGPLLAPDPHGVLVFDFTEAGTAPADSVGASAGAPAA